MKLPSFSLARFWAMVVKEFVQMRRDRVTFGMMLGIPFIQLILFGFAINSDPKHLPMPRCCSRITARTAAPFSWRSATATTSTSSAR